MSVLLRHIPAILVLVGLMLPASALATRIKDIAGLEGVRDNQLVGYGLVVGLNGTGDSASTQFTVQSLVNMMERLGVTVDRDEVKVDNVAAVIVTADLPPFARAGSGIDVLVSSIGDAESLAGGTLLMTPLKGPDGNIYAVAQGPLVVGSLAFGGKAAKVQSNHPTVGRIPGGALVEREVPYSFGGGDSLSYRLKDADFTTASRMSSVINSRFGAGTARAVDGGTLQVRLPEQYRGRTVEFVADLEGLEVTPDATARIVVNERTGTIVMGEEVRISTIAVSHGNLNLVISESAQVSQPGPFSEGQTVVVPQTSIEVSEEGSEIVVLEKGVSIGEVARALNAIGATPRDLIAIFQAIKAAGALHAELVIL
ncbi:flagellar P-ring protein [Desulfuromonas versatilis]|uniref:Flagellar P-ring protein n=1 Tax=Desulfuromonas versatilis TaxID=2802975 RepID=A0ABN6E4A4_9BACT|nr:flagellar basal body P-ring protein FlgI [Desulfuromonas versatilis]BCR06609.1 flagellar P-ring protein [Desulfuromonas versatilis]